MATTGITDKMGRLRTELREVRLLLKNISPQVSTYHNLKRREEEILYELEQLGARRVSI